MKSFQSKNAYWDFAKVIRTERRFIFDGKAGRFLAAVRAASKSRVRAVKSGLERGTNVVLFNVHVAKLIHRFVYTLKKVRYDFEAVPNYAIWRKNKKNGGGQAIIEISTESPQ